MPGLANYVNISGKEVLMLGKCLGASVAHFRKKRDLKQYELAALSEVSRSYISHVEAGRRVPEMDVLGEIAAALGVGVIVLLAPYCTATEEGEAEQEFDREINRILGIEDDVRTILVTL